MVLVKVCAALAMKKNFLRFYDGPNRATMLKGSKARAAELELLAGRLLHAALPF